MKKSDTKKIDELVKQAQEGSVDAFGDIYDFFLSPIYRFIYYKVTQQELAEDLTEDTFLKAWQKLKTYKKTSFPFSSWLYKIAHNTVIDHMRKQKVSIEELVMEIHDERMDSTEFAQHHYNQQLLQKALVKLPEAQREVIILKYVNELSNNEIATVLDKTETAVRILSSRAIAKLKEIMEILETSLKKE